MSVEARYHFWNMHKFMFWNMYKFQSLSRSSSCFSPISGVGPFGPWLGGSFQPIFKAVSFRAYSRSELFWPDLIIVQISSNLCLWKLWR